MDLLRLLGEKRLLPLLTVQESRKLRKIAEILLENRLPLLEITLRTEAGFEALKTLSGSGLILGAGTVRTLSQAHAALKAGARFLVSPGLNEALAVFAREQGVLYFPGVLTPSEVEKALSLGLSVLKFFPSEVFNGPRVLRAYREVFPEARFIPTGGIQEDMLPEYMQLQNVLACGGSWLLEGDEAEIQDKIHRAMTLIGAGSDPSAYA
jgi:2-dehydro-3-deoxyphosphogluconate aldolase/(4S)-4-hydroxy-2-oxoglutarate aldolase